jgi:hypothetical protein
LIAVALRELTLRLATMKKNGFRVSPRQNRVFRFENGQHRAGTRRVRENEHERSRAGTADTPRTLVFQEW